MKDRQLGKVQEQRDQERVQHARPYGALPTGDRAPDDELVLIPILEVEMNHAGLNGEL